MNKGLKNKGLGSWFCLAAALVALITGIVFLLTQATAAPLGHSGTMAGVVLLVGAAASLVFFFVSVPFSALIQAVIYNIALYLVVVQLIRFSSTKTASTPDRSSLLSIFRASPSREAVSVGGVVSLEPPA